MFNHFFHLLPSDLHVCVLQIWIGDDNAIICALSKLDRACCQKSIRPALLALLQGLMPLNEPIPINDLTCFVSWLHSRQVSITSILTKNCLRASDGPWTQLILPSIHTVVCSSIPADCSTLVRLLQLCPNITSLEVEANHLMVYNDFMWGSLLDLPMKLNRLVVPHKRVTMDLMAFLGSMASSLTTLELNHVPLSATLTLLLDMPKLTRLSINAFEVTATLIVQLVRGCRNLRELVLFAYFPTECDLDDILTAGRGQLTSLEVILTGPIIGIATFTSMLTKHPWLQRLKLQANEHNRQTGFLALSLEEDTHIDVVYQLCAACSNVTKLSVRNAIVEEAVANVLGEAFGQQVIDLELWEFSRRTPKSTEQVISVFPHLRCLSVLSLIELEQLQCIAKHCKKLEELSLASWKSTSITDEGLQHVLLECSKLKQLAFKSTVCNVTSKSLDAILENRLPLQALHARAVGYTKVDVIKFRAMAREQQLLPVPVIEGTFPTAIIEGWGCNVDGTISW